MNSDKNIETLVSIIMPAYNCARYIKDSIDSVIKQTYNKWELIVIDDGSNDNTVQIIEELSKQDTRIRFFKNNKNQGVSATRNKGIALAKGGWIAFLDSDDIWNKKKLEKQMNCANEKSAEFLFTGASYINKDGDFYKGIFEIPGSVCYENLRKHNVISCSSVLVKKNYVEKIKMEKDEMHEDYAVWLRILKLGVIAYGINEPLLTYRISCNSKSGNKFRTIKMTYKVFRFIGMGRIESIYFMVSHIIKSIEKYRKIGSVNKGLSKRQDCVNDIR